MDLHGVFAPIPTPFDDSQRFDAARLRAALARWASSSLTGIVVLGSTGEAILLDEDESDAVVVSARESWPIDRRFIVGTGRESTSATIRATKRAADLGAEAVLVRTPGFFKTQMTTDAFVRHYTAVADASPVPVLLYNFTAVTGVNLLPAAVSRLATHPNIIGVKESGGDLAQIADFVACGPRGFNVLAGSASVFQAALSVGAAGGILALSCVVPDACVRLFELMKGGRDALGKSEELRHTQARTLQGQLLPTAKLVGSVYGVPGLKAALKLTGCDVGIPRAPLVPAPDAAVAAIRESLAALTTQLLQPMTSD